MLKKSIIIDHKHADQITAAIAEAEGRAKVRRIDAETVISGAKDVDRYFHDIIGLTRKEMHGIIVKVNYYHDLKFANAYKYSPEATFFEVEYKTTGWRLIDVRRSFCKGGPKNEAVFPEELSADTIALRVSRF